MLLMANCQTKKKTNFGIRVLLRSIGRELYKENLNNYLMQHMLLYRLFPLSKISIT